MKYQFDFEKPNKTPRTTKVAEDKQLVQKKIEELLEEAKVETLKMKNDFNMIGKKRKLSLNQIDGDFDKVCKAILFSPSSSQCKFDDLINKEKSIKAKIDEIEEKLSKVDNRIKEKAKLLSRNKKFKASKGWFSKFRKNYNIVTVISYEKRKKDNIN